MTSDSTMDDTPWIKARKKPVAVEFKGPFYDPRVVETLEGNFNVDQDYIDEHEGYVVIKGVEGEIYPCGYKIFLDTYTVIGTSDVVCSCRDPKVQRTLAKGTPDEREFCRCGGYINDTEDME